VSSSHAAPAQGKAHTVSSGHGLATVGWLDTHFEACRAEYLAMVRSVPFQPGWRVLDAGCGSGSFLPALADMVGSTGSVVALDAAPENIDAIRGRVAEGPLACSAETIVGSAAALPFPDASFDAVWCANVAQYFSDEALPDLLGELVRVVRPGGLVAVKDVDMTLLRLHPADPFLVAHLSEVSVRRGESREWSEGSLRARVLRRHLERAGLADVWQRTTLIERWAPFSPVERELWTSWMTYLATIALERGVPDEDLAAWESLRDPADPQNPLNDREAYTCEGQVVAVGTRVEA
jgi:ubiquinone/menaquinone biosynthesis C-methylase UbiE